MRITSATRGLNILYGKGASFGEASLLESLTTVRREATVTAHENCYILQFKAEDMQGLNVELAEVALRAVTRCYPGGQRQARGCDFV